MKLEALQNNLREIVQERINTRELTGLRLSQITGFRQAHVSNFLNRKRGLSLEGMDRVLRALKLTVFDLIDPKDITLHLSRESGDQRGVQDVLLVSNIDAWRPRISRRQIQDVFPFQKTFLRRFRASMIGDRRRWERFLLIRMEGSTAQSMFPKMGKRTIALIDRHYNSLQPYDKTRRPNLYAVRYQGKCAVRCVEKNGEQLLFRPLNAECPIAVVNSTRGNKNFVIGRVCYIGSEP